MLRTIMVPLDGSPLAERALPYAEGIARVSGARLALVRVAWVRPLPGQHPAVARVGPMEEAEAYLAGVARRFAGSGLPVDTGVREEQPVEGLLAEIESRCPDLIVMATHGRDGLGRLAFGSVAGALAARTAVPVLLIRAGGQATAAQPFASRPRILVPVDGSVFAEEALPLAAGLVDLLDGELLLLRAISPDDRLAGGEEQAQARIYLNALAARFASTGRRISCEIRGGVPAAAIAAAGRDDKAALVVMATHGRGGLGRLALGSVADAVLHRGDAPLLLVRPSALQATAGQAGATATTCAT